MSGPTHGSTRGRGAPPSGPYAGPYRRGPTRPPDEGDAFVGAVFTVVACAILGSCWVHEPGGLGLSPGAAALAFAALVAVLVVCGMRNLGCLGALLVLAGVGQVAMTRTPPAAHGGPPTAWGAWGDRAGPLVLLAAGLLAARWAWRRRRRRANAPESQSRR